LAFPGITIETDINYYFTLIGNTSETRLQHIMRHYYNQNRDSITVKEALCFFYQKPINPLESTLDEIKELFDYITDVTSMKYDDTLVYHTVSTDSNKIKSKHLTFYHLGTNILIHLRYDPSIHKYIVLTCYVHTRGPANTWDLENGICAITEVPLQTLAGLSDEGIQAIANNINKVVSINGKKTIKALPQLVRATAKKKIAA
jgi:hypothetical protein